MSAGINTIHADTLKSALNTYAGKKLDAVKAMVAMPKELWLAVIYYTAYQIYNIDGLGLLDGYSCNSTSVSQNLTDDNRFAGTAAIAPVPAKGGNLTAIFNWVPKDAKGNVISDYKAAALGTLTIIDYNGDQHVIQTRVIGYPGYKKGLEEVQDTPPPADDSYYDDDEVLV
jgi:hypothetical protein